MKGISKRRAFPRNEQGRNDDTSWAARSAFWIDEPHQRPKLRTTPRQHHSPLIISGHGAGLYVNNGTLIVRSGFTHYPQKAEERRFFPRDPNLPSRIISVDGSGSISFAALDWLASQKVPLIRINWRGDVQTVIGWSGYTADPRKVAKQVEATKNGRGLEIATRLIDAKILNGIETLKVILPSSRLVRDSIGKLRLVRKELYSERPKSIASLLGREGQAANAYFEAWQSMELNWTGTGRRPIPADWYRVGPRSSVTRMKIKNRNASHPVNAILNYAYAVLESQVHIQIVSEGYAPTIAFLHKGKPERPALVFDFMEPLRPIVDRMVLKFIKSETFHPADFTIRSDGVCRLNPEMARKIVGLVSGNDRQLKCENGSLPNFMYGRLTLPSAIS